LLVLAMDNDLIACQEGGRILRAGELHRQVIGMIAVVEEPWPILLDLLREYLIVLEPKRLDTIPRLAGRHSAERNHFLAAGKKRDVVDPLLTDLVVPQDLAGVVQHDDVGVAERRDRADDDFLAVLGDIEAGDPHPGQRSEAACIPARRLGCLGLLSGKRDAPGANEQASHEDSSHVRGLSPTPRGHANSQNRPPVFRETNTDRGSRPRPAARLPSLVTGATTRRPANHLDGILWVPDTTARNSSRWWRTRAC